MSNPSQILAERLMKESPPGSLEHNMAREVLARLKRQDDEALVLIMPPEGDGWIKWEGGTTPPDLYSDEKAPPYMNELVRVDVRFRSGLLQPDHVAGCWSWRHGSPNPAGEIVWYRRTP
jgi:hypothetical protein